VALRICPGQTVDSRFPRPEWKVLKFELVCLHLREHDYEAEVAGRVYV